MNKKDTSLEDFKFDIMMNRLRYLIMNKLNENDDIIEIEWLLRILLTSKELFKSVKEVDVFLSNMTGLTHNTKSTGRDRIVDWYLKEIKKYDITKQNKILYKTAKYLFISLPSNYNEWKKIIYKEGARR